MEQWETLQSDGSFVGAPVDLADGYIHFSTARQVRETAAKHFKGQDNLKLVAVNAVILGKALRYEPSRGGALFPHLYGTLPIDAVHRADTLKLGENDIHIFPQDF